MKYLGAFLTNWKRRIEGSFPCEVSPIQIFQRNDCLKGLRGVDMKSKFKLFALHMFQELLHKVKAEKS